MPFKPVKSPLINLSIALFLTFSICSCGGSSGDGGSDKASSDNVTPIANAGTDQTVDEGSVITLSGSGSDSDGSITTYSWTQTTGEQAVIESNSSAETLISIPDIDSDSTLTFELTVTDNDGAPHSDEVVIQVNYINDVVVLSSSEATSITSKTETSFQVSDTSNLASKKIGDIVIADSSNELPYGLFAKITEKTTDNGVTTFVTEQPGLKEVITEGELSISETFSPSDFAAMTTSPSPAGMSLFIRNDNLTYSSYSPQTEIQTLSNFKSSNYQSTKQITTQTSWDADVFQGCSNPDNMDSTPTVAIVMENVGLYQNNKDSDELPIFDTGVQKLYENEDYDKIVAIDGCIGLNYSYNFNLDFNLFGSDHYLFTVTPEQYGELKITGEISKELEIERELQQWELPKIKVLVGAVPVWITPEITIMWGLNATAEATIFTGVSEYAGVEFGIEYKDKQLSPVLDPYFEFNYQPPTLALSAEAESYIGPNLALKIYDLVGPNADLQLYVNALVQNQDPWWKLSVGARAGAGIKVEILDKEIEKLSFTIPSIIDKEINSWQAQSPLLSAPVNIDAQEGDSSILLSWDEVPSASEYTVFYGTSTDINTFSDKVEVSSNSTTVTGLISATKYYFIVVAHSEDTASPFSEILAATTLDTSDDDEVDLTEGIVAYYPFDGDFVDISKNELDLTAYGDATIVNDELYLDGDGDYLETKTLDDTWNEWSVSVFVKPEDVTQSLNHYTLIERERIGGYQDFDLTLVGGTGAINVENDNDVNLRSTSLVIDNTWSHIVVTYDGVRKKIFINGELDSEVEGTNAQISVQEPIIIGRHANTSARNYFKGYMDEVRIYNRELTHNEIEELYEKDKPTEPSDNTINGLALSDTKAEYGSDYNQICINEFGSDWGIADWTTIEAYYSDGGDLSSLVLGVGFDVKTNAWVTRNDDPSYSGSRDYFASYHNYNKPSGYLAHDNIDNYFFSLGSWYGTYWVLCEQSSFVF